MRTELASGDVAADLAQQIGDGEVAVRVSVPAFGVVPIEPSAAEDRVVVTDS